MSVDVVKIVTGTETPAELVSFIDSILTRCADADQAETVCLNLVQSMNSWFARCRVESAMRHIMIREFFARKSAHDRSDRP